MHPRPHKRHVRRGTCNINLPSNLASLHSGAIVHAYFLVLHSDLSRNNKRCGRVFLLNAEAATRRESEKGVKKRMKLQRVGSKRACIRACPTKSSLFQYAYYRDSRYRNYARRRRVM